MDGPTRVQLQIRAGLRPIVSDLDSLKCEFGLDRSTVLTPNIESNLRQGKPVVNALRLQFIFPSILAEFQFPRGYPNNKLKVILTANTNLLEWPYNVSLDDIQTKIDEFISNQIIDSLSNSGYAVSIVKHVNCLLEEFSNFSVPIQHSNNNNVNEHDINIDKSNDSKEQNSIISPDDNLETTITHDLFLCRICRTELFNSEHLTSHTPNPEKSFRQGSYTGKCSSVFINDPTSIEWLASSVNRGENDRILCPHCSAKLGSWNWSGSQCSCKS
jgi:hypothetical protein